MGPSPTPLRFNPYMIICHSKYWLKPTLRYSKSSHCHEAIRNKTWDSGGEAIANGNYYEHL